MTVKMTHNIVINMLLDASLDAGPFGPKKRMVILETTFIPNVGEFITTIISNKSMTFRVIHREFIHYPSENIMSCVLNCTIAGLTDA